MLGLIGFGAFKMHEHDKGVIQQLELKHDNYVHEVEQIGMIAERKAREEDTKNKAAKEKYDAKYKVDVVAARADGERLQRDRARRGYLPGSAASASSGIGACFDGAKLESAIRRLDEGVQGLVSEGAQAVKGLDAVKLRRAEQLGALK